jgi:hypothetical protein
MKNLIALFITALAAACGGGGGDTTPDGGATAAASKVFVGDAANAAIGSTPNSNPSAGTLVVQRVISGASTQLTTSMFDFAIDATNDRLYVADLRNILVFNGASTATGNVAPSRILTTIPGSSGGFNGGIYLDTTNNRLYAGTNILAATQTVQVFDNASTASGVPPTRTITFTMRNILDIAVDATRNILYVYGADTNGFTQILAFDNASTLNGAVTPNRTLSINDSGGGGPVGFFLDPANDRLYVPRNVGTISVFEAAHLLNDGNLPAPAPSRTINMQPTTLGYSVVLVDVLANRLYALDRNGVNVIANASTVNGSPTIIRAIAPGGSAFQAIAVKP